MKLNKKATYAADTAPFYLIFAVVVTILFMVFVFMVTSYSTSKIEVSPELKEYLLYQRFLRSPECFAYEDISGRAYPLMIDLKKFNKQNIDSCYKVSENLPAFNLILATDNTSRSLSTENWNQDIGPQRRESPKIIYVYSSGNIQKASMIIEVQTNE